MSNNRNKSKKSGYKGASRPIDPRNAPGARGARPQKRDNFGLILIGSSTAFVLLVILVFVTTNGFGTANSTTTTTSTTNTNNQSAANNSGVTTSSTVVLDTSPPTKSIPTQTAEEVDFLTRVAGTPRISIQDVKALQDAGNVKLIDVRVTSDYNIEHIKGAVSIPNNVFQQRLTEFPKTGNVVLYCQCPNDEESAGVATSLVNAGWTNVKIMRGPYVLTEWKNAGFPTESSSGGSSREVGPDQVGSSK